ncbi:MAG: hypothetical protein HY011_02100 [Acidobacteria bacterium]|nr:hypothetical protein [Acidobacteriota bacterium]
MFYWKPVDEEEFNHMVLLIGWDDEENAWIIQNSYGTDWGDSCDGAQYTHPDDARADDRGYTCTCTFAATAAISGAMPPGSKLAFTCPAICG